MEIFSRMKTNKSLSQILEKEKNKTPDQEEIEAKLLAQVLTNKDQSEPAHDLFVNHANMADKYYTGVEPTALINAKSGGNISNNLDLDYVEPVLYNATKSVIPTLLDTFVKDDRGCVVVRSRGFKKNLLADQILTYGINKMFMSEMNGKQLLQKAFKTGLVEGTAPLIVYPDITTHHETDPLGDEWIEVTEYLASLDDGWTIDSRSLPDTFLQTSGKFKNFEWDKEEIPATDPNTGEPAIDPETGKPVITDVWFIRGKIPLIKTDRKIVVDPIEPNDFYIDTDYGDDINKARHMTRRVKTTVGEAKLRGFDPEKIEKAFENVTDSTELPEMYFSRVNYENPVGTIAGRLDRATSIDPEERPINLWESYLHSSLPNENGEVDKWQVIHTEKDILRYVKVKRFPVVVGRAEILQGQTYGRGFFDIAKQFQDKLSLAQRMSQEVAAKTTWPQYIAVKGQYDRQSLLNNRPGQVVEQMSVGAVDRLMPLQLTETFISAHENLKQSADATISQPVGISNSDGGLPQVSTATAYLSIFQENSKMMELIETFKTTLVEPLFRLMIDIALENDFPFYAPDGSLVDNSQLPRSVDIIVDTSNTHDDFAQNMHLKDVASFVFQSVQFPSPVITPQNTFEIAKDMLDKADLDWSRYLTDPSQNVDPHQAEEEAEDKALNSEMKKVQLQLAVMELYKSSEEVAKIAAEKETLILKAKNEGLKDQADSMANLQKIQTDATNAANQILVNAKEVAVKEKQVNYDTILKSHEQAFTINENRVNGRLS